MKQHTYISSIEYINDISFDYIETYSFQRGANFENTNKENKAEYEKLKAIKHKGNHLSKQEENLFEELDLLFKHTQYLINDKGQFHPSSIKTNTFYTKDQEITRLKNILLTEIKDIPSWMCAPIYRDALVFYDNKDRILSTLNICLSCQYMETKTLNHVNSDNKTYELLRQFFKDIGHEIEEE